ncbi:MAG: type II toxin-antitoxin system VapC family toxin, partial [Deltaproteobacteria bacterium]|nr:type II toxin-antitoxin system VapC family toxin [Deltaproteobacteria bacterium]
IKVQLGKLELGISLESFFADFVHDRPLEVVPIELSHLLAYQQLPLLHRDPFDRLLVAQAQALGVPIVTSDTSFARYDVETVWS